MYKEIKLNYNYDFEEGSIMGLLIKRRNDCLVEIHLNRRLSEKIGHRKINQIKLSNGKLFIYPYEEGEEVRDGCKLYEFTDEDMNQVVTYTNLRDEILNPLIKYLSRSSIGYMNYKVRVECGGKRFLEIELIDDTEQLPVNSYILTYRTPKIESI